MTTIDAAGPYRAVIARLRRALVDIGINAPKSSAVDDAVATLDALITRLERECVQLEDAAREKAA